MSGLVDHDVCQHAPFFTPMGANISEAIPRANATWAFSPARPVSNRHKVTFPCATPAAQVVAASIASVMIFDPIFMFPSCQSLLRRKRERKT
jgi:hypothetical protein